MYTHQMPPRKRTPKFEGFINHHHPVAAHRGHSPLCRGIEGLPSMNLPIVNLAPLMNPPPEKYRFAKVLVREKSIG